MTMKKLSLTIIFLCASCLTDPEPYDSGPAPTLDYPIVWKGVDQDSHLNLELMTTEDYLTLVKQIERTRIWTRHVSLTCDTAR